jgi:hypothetical protein
MANGTTLTISTREDLLHGQAVAATDAGDPGEGSVQVIYDDDEPQHRILAALDRARRYVIENHTKR